MATAKLIGINGRFTHSCLALFYLRNELNKNYKDLDTELLQFTINDNYYELLLKLTNGAPEYLFFSSAIWNSELIEKLCIDLQKSLPMCNLIIGGPQATALLEKATFSNVSIVVGEIEAIEEKFYQDLRKKTLDPVYRASFFKMQKKEFSYPYSDNDFSTHLKNRYVYYESSKGCPFRCSYCLSAAEHGLYHKSLKTVESELRHLLSFKPKVVRFIDRTFNDVPERALEIWRLLLLEGGDTLFHFEMAPDRFTEEMFEFLSHLKPGKFQFEIGIQSTHQKTLNAVNRSTDLDIVAPTMRRLARLGSIHLHVDLILGLPYETRESFANSFNMVFDLGAHYIQMGLLKILPNTPMYESVAKYGMKYCNNPPYSILQTKWLDHSLLSELYWFSECVEKFLNNRYFISLWNFFRSKNENMFHFFSGLLSHSRAEGFFERAPTQEFLCTILAAYIQDRNDRAILIEIMRYDWLRCNHRFLPDSLKVENNDDHPQAIRSRLYQEFPQELKGVYTKGGRNQFFRKSFFLRISQEAAKEIGIPVNDDSQYCCFISQREKDLFHLNKVLIL